MQMTPAYHIQRYRYLKNERSALENYWQELAYYCMPRKAYITRFKMLGDRLPTDLFDSTAINAVDQMAAGIQGYLTNPQTRWFGLSLKNRRLMTLPGARDWLRDCEDIIYDTLNGSNYYQENNECYRDLAVIATHCLYVEDDTEDDVRFLSVPIEKVVFAADANGRIKTVYIEYEFDADQATAKFGNAVSTKIQEAVKNKDYTSRFKFLFCVYPRAVFDPSKLDKKNMPFAAEWIEIDPQKQVRESGYREFPFMVSRWAKSGGDVYGSGPAMNELPNIKTLNAMCRTNLIAGEKIADPPLDIPDEAFMRPFDFDAGGINIRAAGYPQEKINPIITGQNIPFALQLEDVRRMSIRQAFFNDLFIILNNQGQMTAEEVRQRVAERMLLLGPAIGLLISENVQPTIERVFNMLARNGKLAPPPRGLEGQEYIVLATSPLARAQRMVELQGLQLSMGIIAQFGQIQPEVFDKIKFDDAVDFVTEITNLNPKLIRDDAEVEEIRANRQAANAMAQQMAMLQQGADTIKTATEADKNLKEPAAAGAA